MAVSLGALPILLPTATLAGLGAFGAVYLLTWAFEASASIGLGLVVAPWWQGQPVLWVGYAALLFVAIGVKTMLDRPHLAAVLGHHAHKPN